MRRTIYLFLLLGLCLPTYAQDFSSTGILTFANGGVTTEDLNKDSFPDILFLKRERFTNLNNRLIRLLNDGEAMLSFTELEISTTNEIFGTPTAADFDQDGDIDIVYSGANEGTLLLFQGEADNTLTETVLAIKGAGRFATADLNGDEFPDMVGLSFVDEEVVAYLNTNGTGFTRTTIYDTGIEPSAFQVVDIDGDGDDDVAVGTDDFTEESLVLLINNGSGMFTKQVIESTSSVVRSVNGISAGDLNGDAKLDLVIVASSKCFSYLQGEALNFTRKEELSNFNTFRSVAVGDFNGDQRDDFVVGDNSGEGITLYTNDGMATPGFVASPVRGITPVFSLSAQDLNRDGDLDLVASNGSVYAFENELEQIPPVGVSSIVVREASIFPNPVGEGFVFLQGEALGLAHTYELLDISGQLVRSGRVDGSGRIDLRGMVPGSYVIRLFEGNLLWGRAKIIKY
ncbi:T9SS type A sorting domain-containing protein [Neolewinella lacunae]|uniref:T9SS type A sorting domain-containing protein n=1 Tax=Neolewinella lacunae TaxID=1517758 RepID=A0A923PFG9_9BACT|nr:T9SS type A sorting domain-containing protein [Neolewinella lacunae]MBC6993120.1 T9SS type A sorting domain-containing protein [Neolewinella lacunae]MDN3635940.1 T9SS type A sorting domain-containing protein [Neolewinella lacunae]